MEINNNKEIDISFIKEENFDIILKHIEIFSPSKNNYKYSNAYYLKNVMMILNTFDF